MNRSSGIPLVFCSYSLKCTHLDKDLIDRKKGRKVSDTIRLFWSKLPKKKCCFAVVLKHLNQNQQICQRKDGMPQQQTVCFTDCAGSLFLQRNQKIVPTGCVFCGLQTDVGITLVSLETYLQCQSLFLNPWCQIRLLQPRAAGAVA